MSGCFRAESVRYLWDHCGLYLSGMMDPFGWLFSGLCMPVPVCMFLKFRGLSGCMLAVPSEGPGDGTWKLAPSDVCLEGLAICWSSLRTTTPWNSLKHFFHEPMFLRLQWCEGLNRLERVAHNSGLLALQVDSSRS